MAGIVRPARGEDEMRRVSFVNQVKAATRELALAFMKQVFGGASDALERWSERHQPIVARMVTAPLR